MSTTVILDLEQEISSVIDQDDTLGNTLRSICESAQEQVEYVDTFKVTGCDGKPFEDYPVNHRGLSHPFFYSKERILARVEYSVQHQDTVFEDILDIKRYVENGKKTREYYLRVEQLDVGHDMADVEKKLKQITNIKEDIREVRDLKGEGDCRLILDHEENRIIECEIILTEQLIFLQGIETFLFEELQSYELFRLAEMRKKLHPANLVTPTWIFSLQEAGVVDPASVTKPYRLLIQQNQVLSLYTILAQRISLNMTQEDFCCFFLQKTGKAVNYHAIRKNIPKDISSIEIEAIESALKKKR